MIPLHHVNRIVHLINGVLLSIFLQHFVKIIKEFSAATVQLTDISTIYKTTLTTGEESTHAQRCIQSFITWLIVVM